MGLVPQVAVVSGLRNSIMNIDTQADLANYLRADVIMLCRVDPRYPASDGVFMYDMWQDLSKGS